MMVVCDIACITIVVAVMDVVVVVVVVVIVVVVIAVAVAGVVEIGMGVIIGLVGVIKGVHVIKVEIIRGIVIKIVCCVVVTVICALRIIELVLDLFVEHFCLIFQVFCQTVILEIACAIVCGKVELHWFLLLIVQFVEIGLVGIPEIEVGEGFVELVVLQVVVVILIVGHVQVEAGNLVV